MLYRQISIARSLALEDTLKHRTKWTLLTCAFAAIMVLGACKKTVVPPPPPSTPPPPAPTASITVSPEAIEKGHAATLSWSTSNATEITIAGIGTVESSGSMKVTPQESTSYNLTAKGPGGTVSDTARVTVTMPPASAVSTQPGAEDKARSAAALLRQEFERNVKDVFFDYDKADIRDAEKAALNADIAFLNAHPELEITIGGYADERGSTEYNLTLSGKRADSVKDALIAGGVAASRIRTIPYGKEKPFCTESTEECWQQNRRGNFVLGN
jgi:peptidoglycan-associated lipoprotein